MKSLADYLPCHSLACRLAAFYAASMVILIAGYTVLFLVLMQHRANVEVDHALGEELAIQVNRAAQELSNAPKGNVTLSSEGGQATRPRAMQISVDAWAMQRSNPTQATQQVWRGGDAPALSSFQTASPQHQAFNIESEGANWRAMQGRAVSPTAEPLLIRVALPTKSLETMTQDILYYAGWSVPFLLLLAFSIGLIVVNTAFAPMKAVIRSTQAIRPHQLNQRFSVHGRTNEIGELCNVMNQLLDRVQIALQQQARFATEVAHELRTPLAAQRSVGEMALRAKNTDDPLRNSISAMLEEGQHMHKFVDSLLLVAQASTGMLSQNLAPTNATSVIQRCVRTMQPLAEANSQKLSCSVGADCTIFADETLLRQTLLNLIHNAVKHTQTFSQIEVRATQCVDSVIITVSDNGPGFSKFNRDQLVRKEPRKKFDYSDRGLGLGLSIVQSLVRAQEGKMSVSSQSGRGTVVQLVFKRLAVRKNEAAVLKPVSAGPLRMPIPAT